MSIDTIRHSFSHIMAAAVLEIYPEAKFGIGPSIDNGFYYDIKIKENLKQDDLEKISKVMKEIIERKIEFERQEISRREANDLFKDQPYKVELVKEIPDSENISIYKVGKFVDLCRGPHVQSTNNLNSEAFTLLHVSTAYWKGDQKEDTLQRIYGTAWTSKKELKRYLHLLEEAKKRDHRKIGRELDLFSQPGDIGSGLVLFHPKGAIIRKTIENFELDEHLKRGYQYVYTPHIYKADVWKLSGHYTFYKDNMFLFKAFEQEYGLKPMNCPGHVMIYKSRSRSYRDLPIKYFELGTVYRRELSGVLQGLLRVTSITQDDAHIFCRKDQLEEEINKVIKFAIFMMETFGFEYKFTLSTKPEKSLGSDEIWKLATDALKNALKKNELKYDIEEGGGAFYGPKIDVNMKDAINRWWQGPTIQIDFNFPERFNLEFVNSNGEKERPVMIHRTVLGSMERFMGVLIEHYAGRYPLWLAPVQVKLLTILNEERIVHYAEELNKKFLEEKIRSELDISSNTLNYKIRAAQNERIPYVIVLG
ncbi:MAG: threonine--tRNA ligase [Promethearchaeota archaeon]